MSVDATSPPAKMSSEELDETASRLLRRWNDSHSVSAPPPPHPVKDIVLPLAVVIGLIGNAWYGGVNWGRVSTQLETLISTLTQTVGVVSAHSREITDLQTRMKAQEDNLRLFKMYTKGRIARLPYRASDDGE